MIYPLAYPSSLLEAACLGIAFKYPNLSARVRVENAFSAMEMHDVDKQRSLVLTSADRDVRFNIGEVRNGSNVCSSYWASSKGTNTGFCGLGLQLDLPEGSIIFDGRVDGHIGHGIVHLHGEWTTRQGVSENAVSGDWHIDVRNQYMDEPILSARVGKAIFACMQNVLLQHLQRLGLTIPEGIQSFQEPLELLYSANYIDSVGSSIVHGSRWVSALELAPTLEILGPDM